jgi:SAM-dependent methyltransferase
MRSDRRQHWDEVYGTKSSVDVSWYQPVPETSLRLIGNAGVAQQDPVIDAGGGASTLVDHLLEGGYSDVTILDVARNGLGQARNRLGPRAAAVNWIVADVLSFEPPRQYRLWHDRAVLHFLVDEEERERYVAVLRNALAPGGQLVLATFGPRGPLKCSGLEIRRYTIEKVEELLGPGFELQAHELEDHRTPGGATQQFLYSSWTWRGA